MAKKYLDYDGLAYFWEKIKTKLTGKLNDVNYDTTNHKLYKTKEGTNTDIVSVSTLKTDMALTKADVGLGNVTDGAQVNVLEGIQKNGTTVTITNKIANISVPVATSELTNDSGYITSHDIPPGAAASTTTPKMDGTAEIGTELAFARGDHRHPTDTSRAPLASPALTGTPTAPTAAVATDSTQIATTAFVHDVVDALDTGVSDVQIGTTSIVDSGVATIPTGSTSALGVVKVTTGNGLIISSGTISMALATASTAGAMSATDKNAIGVLETSATANYVLTATTNGPAWAALPTAGASTPGITKLYTSTGSSTDGTMDRNSITTALNTKAPLASPTLTGTPTAPTATAGTNTTQIATTAFVTSAIQTAQTGAAAFQGTAPTTFAPTNYKTGYYWVVGTAGMYAGEACEPGDMIFAVADYDSAYQAADFNVIQTNLDITSITNAEIDTIMAA